MSDQTPSYFVPYWGDYAGRVGKMYMRYGDPSHDDIGLEFPDGTRRLYHGSDVRPAVRFVLSTVAIPGEDSLQEAWPLVKETATDYLVVALFDYWDEPRRRALPLWWTKERCKIVLEDDPVAQHLVGNEDDTRIVYEWLKKYSQDSLNKEPVAADK